MRAPAGRGQQKNTRPQCGLSFFFTVRTLHVSPCLHLGGAILANVFIHAPRASSELTFVSRDSNAFAVGAIGCSTVSSWRSFRSSGSFFLDLTTKKSFNVASGLRLGASASLATETPR